MRVKGLYCAVLSASRERCLVDSTAGCRAEMGEISQRLESERGRTRLCLWPVMGRSFQLGQHNRYLVIEFLKQLSSSIQNVSNRLTDWTSTPGDAGKG